MDFEIRVSSANGRPGGLSMGAVWGVWSDGVLTSPGMVVARGLPSDMDAKQRDKLIDRTYPTRCPIWNDELLYKSVTIICDAALVEEVSYWIEYVQGAGSVSNIKDLSNGRVALRSDYMCW